MPSRLAFPFSRKRQCPVNPTSTVKKFGRATDGHIVALRDIPRHKIRRGDRGDFVGLSATLAQDGDCWIGPRGTVLDGAILRGDAIVTGNAIVRDSARVGGRAKILGGRVVDRASVAGHALLEGNATVAGDATVSGEATIGQHATVLGRAFIAGDAKVSAAAHISGDAVVHATTDYMCLGPLGPLGHITVSLSDGLIHRGKRSHTVDQFMSLVGDRAVLLRDLIRSLLTEFLEGGTAPERRAELQRLGLVAAA